MITVLVAVILALMQSMVNSQSYIQVSAVSPYTAYIHIEGPLVRPINLTGITNDIKCGVLEYSVVNRSLINILLKVPWNGRLLICNLTLLLGALRTEPKLILVNTSKIILISVSLSQGNLTVAYMGIDWFLFALSILLLTWQIPTIAVFGRMALKKQITSTKTAQIYSFSIITSFPLQIIWLILFLIGLSAGLLYFEPLLYVLRPIIGDYQWNLGLSIVTPVVLAIVSTSLIQRHYVNALKRLIKDKWSNIVDEKALRKFSAIILISIFLTGGVYGFASWFTFIKLSNSPWFFRGAILAVVFASMTLALNAIIANLGPRLLYGKLTSDPRVQDMVNDIWVKMGRLGNPPKAYVSEHIMGSRYNAVAISGNRIIVAESLMNMLTTEELYSVLVHEVSHIRHRHINALTILIITILASFSLALSYAASKSFPIWSAPVIIVVFLSGFIPIIRFVQRRLESQADADAAKAGFNPRAYISALGKLTKATMMPLRFGPIENVYLTHPAPVNRILKIAKKYGIPEDEALRIFADAYSIDENH